MLKIFYEIFFKNIVMEIRIMAYWGSVPFTSLSALSFSSYDRNGSVYKSVCYLFVQT